MTSLRQTSASLWEMPLRNGYTHTQALPQLASAVTSDAEICVTCSRNGSARSRLTRAQEVRLAVLLLFCDPISEPCSRFLNMSNSEWQDLLRWLDFSGLALYFLDRIVELELCGLLPPAVFTRLHLNLIDNTERTQHMLSESVAIQMEFQEAGLRYANLKGISLWPSAVAKPELRSQFDVDFLVGDEGAHTARDILERRGYRLYAISGRSWEFKRNERPGVSLKDIYKHFDSYGVELHLEGDHANTQSPLDRVQWREVNGARMPVLAPVDLFLGQGLHVFKHLCGEFTRASQLLEFRQHVITRRNDDEFWNELRVAASDNPRASLGLGVATLLITHVMGEFAPEALTSWTIDRLPPSVRLWVELYGHRAVFGRPPGTKLYLLLRRALQPSGVPGRRSIRSILLPAQLPPPVIRAFPNEAPSVRLRRYLMQIETVLVRFRFHVTEGLRYAYESRRWRRMNGLSR